MTSWRDPGARARRKADLLAASSLLRLHATGAVDELTDLADALSHRVAQLRALAASPIVRLAGVTLIVALVVRGRARSRHAARSGLPVKRTPAAGLWPWAAMAWRLWRLGRPVLMRGLIGNWPPRP